MFIVIFVGNLDKFGNKITVVFRRTRKMFSLIHYGFETPLTGLIQRKYDRRLHLKFSERQNLQT